MSEENKSVAAAMLAAGYVGQEDLDDVEASKLWRRNRRRVSGGIAASEAAAEIAALADDEPLPGELPSPAAPYETSFEEPARSSWWERFRGR